MNDKKRDLLRILAAAGKGVTGLVIRNSVFLGMATNPVCRDSALICALVFTVLGMLMAGSPNPLKLGEDVCNLIGDSCVDVAKSFRDAYRAVRDKIRGNDNVKTK